jgi:hypothetical protein
LRITVEEAVRGFLSDEEARIWTSLLCFGHSHYRDEMLRISRQRGRGSGVGTGYTEAHAVPYIFRPGPI